MLKGKTILLGVSGGIAAYKSAYLASALVKLGCKVNVIMTKNATNFIGPATFEALTSNRTLIDTFDRNHEFSTEHISIADQTDLVIIAPATANVIAKFANGIADDMLTTTVLATSCPKFAYPAMNTGMYENPVTKDNLEKLKAYNWEVKEPEEGRLACGTSGKGRMPEVETIVDHVINFFSEKTIKDMFSLKVLVTAGPTVEAIDPVRYITNRSSGKMGYAIAKKAYERGAEVVLVSGPTNIEKPKGPTCIDIESANDMYEAVSREACDADIIIMAAAVADYTPAVYVDEKIKKSDDDYSINLKRTKDILKELGQNKKAGQTLCGFAMETQNLIVNAKEKLKKKNLDLIAANSTKVKGAGFRVDTNLLTLLTPNDSLELPLMSKDDCADQLLNKILEIRK